MCDPSRRATAGAYFDPAPLLVAGERGDQNGAFGHVQHLMKVKLADHPRLIVLDAANVSVAAASAISA